MASPAVRPPATLPADFKDWDKPNAPPAVLPPDFNKWDQPTASAAETPTATVQPKSLLTRVQDSFDTNTRTSPKEPLLQTGLKSVVGAVGAPFVHPLKTASGMLSMIADSPDYPQLPMKVNGQLHLPTERSNPLLDQGIQAYHDYKDGGLPYAATKLGGQVLGAELLGGAVKSGVGAAGSVGDTISTLRDAAIGDPQAAALRGLRVGPASNKALSTLSAVEGSRPFLQGARSLEDLQSRIPVAKDQIWSPYNDALSRVGNKQTPLGTLNELEARRMEVSAQLRALKSGDPQAVALAQQKGLTQADLLDEERNIKATLDPELRKAGVDPLAIRKAFAQVGTVERRVAGKSTVAEKPQPYGLGKLTGFDLAKPLKSIPIVKDAVTDIAAGRPLFSGKPTDISIREAFRKGGSKPNFYVDNPIPQPAGYLEAGTIGMPGGEDYSIGGIPNRPSVITPQPQSFPRLPASVSSGEALPMIGVRATPPPALAADFARTRIRPTEFASPEIIPPRGFTADALGAPRPNPLFLESGAPKALAKSNTVIKSTTMPKPAAKPRIHEDTGLPLNDDGTVTLYHGTSQAGAAAIRATGRLKSAGEPSVYLTTAKQNTGYGDGTVVPVRVDPSMLQLDDEFPDGRRDFSIDTGRPGGSIRVKPEISK
jgi:hypothetical protein